jgi:putative FmdB family regulatory protein
MLLFEFQCDGCGLIFEALTESAGSVVPCLHCGSTRTRKVVSAPAVHMKDGRAASQIGRIEKRVKGYLLDGKVADATRFADKAASMVKSDRVKRIADKLHRKTGK